MLQTALFKSLKRQANGGCVDIHRSKPVRSLDRVFRIIFSRENLYALLICLILIAILILTADQSPQWIYQGF